jgi:hypothetical protein
MLGTKKYVVTESAEKWDVAHLNRLSGFAFKLSSSFAIIRCVVRMQHRLLRRSSVSLHDCDVLL